MSAFLIFDQQNNLIFSHCNRQFQSLLMQLTKGSDDDKTLPGDEDHRNEVVHNLITLYLTPYVATYRHRIGSAPSFDQIPDTTAVYMNPQTSNNYADQLTVEILLKRKVSLFCQLVIFLYGDALYSISKYDDNLRFLFKILNRWIDINWDIPFLVESSEKLFLGNHVVSLCKTVISQIEYRFKLKISLENLEMPSCYLLMFKDRFIYKFESANVHLNQDDLQLILLLSLSVNLYATCSKESAPSVTNVAQANRPPNHSKSSKADYVQRLVFLKSSYVNCQIPVPHIYRKVIISQDLYLICLSELSSMMIISLSTLIESVSRIKHDFERNISDSQKTIDVLISCVRNLDKYIAKSGTTCQQSESIIVSLKNLSQLAKKSTNDQTLISEQVDRILTIITSNLHSYYEEIAFKGIYGETFAVHALAFERVAPEIIRLLYDQFSTCLDFINVKYDTRSMSLIGSSENYHNLLSFVFIDRARNHFILNNLSNHKSLGNQVYQNMIVHGYRLFAQNHKSPVSWRDDYYHYFYWREQDKTRKTTVKTKQEAPTCTIARIFYNKSQMDTPNYQENNNTGNIYEIFGIFPCQSSAELLHESNNNNKIIKIVHLIKGQLDKIIQNQNNTNNNNKINNFWN